MYIYTYIYIYIYIYIYNDFAMVFQKGDFFQGNVFGRAPLFLQPPKHEQHMARIRKYEYGEKQNMRKKWANEKWWVVVGGGGWW